MNKKISSILGVALVLALVLTLGAAFVPANTPVAQADPGVTKWEKFPTPRQGSLNDYLLVPTSSGVSNWAAGPGPLEKGLDGALYAYWDVGAATNLYKSTDMGRSWSRCSGSTSSDVLYHKAIVAIAPAPDDPDLVYVTDGTGVFKSSNGGSSFTEVAPPTLSSETITCLSIASDGDNHWIIIGTALDSGYGGKVWVKQDPYLGPWQDQAMTSGFNVRAIAASPNFEEETNPQIVAVTDNATNTYVRYQWGGGAWTKKAELKCDPRSAQVSFGNVTTADIGFPEDYDSTGSNTHLFVAIDGAGSDADDAGGDIYEVYYTTAYDVDISGSDGGEVDVTSIALGGGSGDEKLIAGAANSRNVYYSTDSASTWTASKKDASGPATTNVYVEVADDFYESGICWAAVNGSSVGDQSALSQSDDFGKSWYQISLIDTEIASMGDFSFSRNFAEDSTMFMITNSTTGGVDSLWKWDGSYWERTYDEYTFGLNGIDLVMVSPEFETDSAVFIADRTGNKIYRATDGGRWFKAQVGAPTWHSQGGWMVVDSKTVLVGKSSNNIHRTTNNGVTWSTKTASGLGIPRTFAISPNFAEDDSMLAGGDSAVFLSTNTGSTWKQIPSGTDVDSGAGGMFVAFDSGYASNETVYAAGASSDTVYRWVDGDTSWDKIDQSTDTSWPHSSQDANSISGLMAGGEGALYVADEASPANSPVLRSINPRSSTSSSSGVFFEPIERDWPAGDCSEALRVIVGPESNTLWVKNTSNAEIWTYEDTILFGPKQLAPENGANTGRQAEVSLAWEALNGASKYFVNVAMDSSFKTGYVGTFGSSSLSKSSATTATTARITSLESGRKYYWRIASADTLTSSGRGMSPWSEVRSFTTGMGGGQWNPFMTAAMEPGNFAPASGADDVILLPTFQWNAADWATGYAFVLADNPDFVNPLIKKTGASALKTTAYMSEVDLGYGSTYYWKVAAIGEDTQSEWGVGVFKTMTEPEEPPPPVEVSPPVTLPPTPAAPAIIEPVYLWAIIAIGAILVIALIVLILRTRRVG